MALKLSTALRAAIVNAFTAAAGASARIRIYSGTRPADVQTAISAQLILADLTAGSTLAPTSTDGVLTLNAITQDSSADNTGTASFFRVFTSALVPVFDGDVNTTGSDLNLNTTAIVVGGPVQISSFTITAPGA